ncbi:hypothetical protein QAD02_021229 [Eretmocerus hayati]|uniref:Uncharacterized protein n=1 Tax=Eretmocerus hayati TaxID=131215 RepID=A0ACC2PRJ7_9HYME|nr:hypothetical protein QAD02_021229 [Eretmocerus hayati]
MLDENLFQKDISQWRELSSNFVDYWARKCSASIHNKDPEILNSRSYVQIDGSKERKCTISMFDKEIGNGNRKKTVTRAWPCFSPVTGKLYCFHCALFSDVPTQFTDDGFCDWENASCRFEKHEQSKHHLDSILRSCRGKGHATYLSHHIYDELNHIIGEKILDTIFANVRKAGGRYSISLDSTPDAGHIDQLALAISYLENHEPVERFLTFLPNVGHKSVDICDAAVSFLVNRGKLRIKDCRGQSYNNAPAMSGHLHGVQSLIRDQNLISPLGPVHWTLIELGRHLYDEVMS